MITVYQSIFIPPLGNCFSAAVASVMERPLSAVPFFMSVPGAWWEGFQQWCLENDWIAVYYPCKEWCEQERRLDEYLGIPDGYSLMSGLSPRHPGVFHTVVALDGVMVHDPFPNDNRGIIPPYDYITLRRSP